MLKKMLQILGITVLAIAISGCGGTKDTKNEEDGPIVIGGLAPLTGDGAAYGIPLQKVAEIARAEVNEAGGINGRELQIVWEDGKCNGKDAAAAAQKLTSVDKVSIIFGGFCSSETLGAAPIAEQAKVVMLSTGSSSPDVTNAGDYIFRNYPSDSSQGKVVAEIANGLELKKTGMLTEEQDYTIGIEKSYTESFNGFGGEVVSQSFLSTDTDFRTQITKLKSEGIDSLFINPQTPPKADLILKQIQELGVEGIQLMANDVAMGNTEGMAQYPELVEGMLGAEASYNAEDAGFLGMKAKYEAGGETLPYPMYMATTYDGVKLLAEALSEVGNDATAVKGWLYKVKRWVGAAGELTIDANGDPESGHIPKVVKNGAPTEFLVEIPELMTEEAEETTTK